MVVLHSNSPNAGWWREYPDGTSVRFCQSTNPPRTFCTAIPEGMVLVITDVEWHKYVLNTPAGTHERFRIKLINNGNSTFPYQSSASLDATGHAAHNDYTTTGFVAGRDVDISIEDFNLGPDILRGYFVPHL